MSISLPTPYEYVSSIGQGAFGRVVKAHNRDKNIDVACKIVSYEGIKDPESTFKESQIMKHMHHPHIVQCYDVIDDKENSTLYVFMELCVSDLQRLIDDNKTNKQMVPESIVWGFLAQAILALTYLHSPFNKKYQDEEGVTHNIGKVYHRDIKPANLLLDRLGNIKLADFNVSTAIKGDKLNSTKCGTPLYAPPEIHEGVREYHGGAVDIWSLGCTIYHVCALRPPFVAVGMGPLIRMIRSGVYPEMPQFYSKELHEVIENMIRPKPACRISTADLLQHSRIISALEILANRAPSPHSMQDSHGKLLLAATSVTSVLKETVKSHNSDSSPAVGEVIKLEPLGTSVNSGQSDHSNSSVGTMGVSVSSDPVLTSSQDQVGGEDSTHYRQRFDPLSSKVQEVPRIKPMPTTILPKTIKPRIISCSTRNPTPSRPRNPVWHAEPTSLVTVEATEPHNKPNTNGPLKEQRERVLEQSKGVHKLLLSSANKNSAINIRTGVTSSVATAPAPSSSSPPLPTGPSGISPEHEINQMVTKALQNRVMSNLYEAAGIIPNSVGTPERVYSAASGRSFTPTQRTPSVVQLSTASPLRSNTASIVHIYDNSAHNAYSNAAIDVEGNTRLIRACKRSSYSDTIANLNQAGEQNNKGETALLWAAFFNSVTLCRLLVAQEAKLTTKDGNTALMKAAGHGSVQTVELLLNYEAKMRNNDGLTALMFATMNHHTKCVELLAPVEATLSRHDGTTSLIMAATRGYDDIVKILCQYESKMQNRDGKTALMEAAMQDKLSCAQLLCIHEAKMVNKDKKTALIFAAGKGNLELVELLAPYEAGMVDTRNYTGLMYAAMNGHPKVCKALLDSEHGCCDKDGRTALMIAATYNRADCCKILAPVEGNRKGTFFSSALKIAARKGHIESLRNLIAYEGEVFGLEALEVAMREGHENIIKELEDFLDKNSVKREVMKHISVGYKQSVDPKIVLLTT